MKHYGASIQVSEGSSITNLTAPSGTSFPNNANIGELFYKTDTNKLYVCTSEGSPVEWTDATVTTTTVAALQDIADVNVSGSPALATNDILMWDGTEWINTQMSAASTLSGLSDVGIGSPVTGHFLQYNSTSGDWENGIPGANDIGSTVFAKLISGSATYGSTVAGSNLVPSSTENNAGSALSGTWECLGTVGSASYATLWTRIS